MKFNLLVMGAPYSSQANYSALQFCEAVLQQDHSITQVFFYAEGVGSANNLSVLLADEFDAVNEWQFLKERYGINLYVCVSAAERRGVLNAEQATEHAKECINCHPSFEMVGLGELHSASLVSDRTVVFK